jgi:hypothetical protein
MRTAVGFIALAATLTVSAETADLSGTWQMGLEGGHVIPVALVLKQDGRQLTGTIALPTQNTGQRVEVALSGEFVDGALRLAGSVEHARESTTVDITGKLLDDGTLEGRFTMTGHGNLPWTAERLTERK